MSFSVRAGSPSPPQRSPVVRPIISPQMRAQAPQFIPSLSISDEQPSQPPLPPPQPPHGLGKRGGTDPTKYKTTMCRNWEQTGTCNFRGCTFAHGVEELRAPSRPDRHTPSLHPQPRISPTHTPLLIATQQQQQQQQQQSLPPPPPLSSQQLLLPPAGSGYNLEELLEMLYVEVMRERELVAVHMEANRKLEAMLYREQAQHEETKALLEEKQRQYAVLVSLVSQQSEKLKEVAMNHAEHRDKIDETLQKTLHSVGGEMNGNKSALNCVADLVESIEMEMNKSAEANSESAEEEKAHIEELLRALQQE